MNIKKYFKFLNIKSKSLVDIAFTRLFLFSIKKESTGMSIPFNLTSG